MQCVIFIFEDFFYKYEVFIYFIFQNLQKKLLTIILDYKTIKKKINQKNEIVLSVYVLYLYEIYILLKIFFYIYVEKGNLLYYQKNFSI